MELSEEIKELIQRVELLQDVVQGADDLKEVAEIKARLNSLKEQNRELNEASNDVSNCSYCVEFRKTYYCGELAMRSDSEKTLFECKFTNENKTDCLHWNKQHLLRKIIMERLTAK